MSVVQRKGASSCLRSGMGDQGAQGQTWTRSTLTRGRVEGLGKGDGEEEAVPVAGPLLGPEGAETAPRPGDGAKLAAAVGDGRLARKDGGADTDTDMDTDIDLDRSGEMGGATGAGDRAGLGMEGSGDSDARADVVSEVEDVDEPLGDSDGDGCMLGTGRIAADSEVDRETVGEDVPVLDRAAVTDADCDTEHDVEIDADCVRDANCVRDVD